MAGGGREVEFKFRVDGPAAFEALARVAGARPSAPVTQINHFFDTADRALSRARFTLRLREESGRFVLTAKGPGEGEGTLKSRTEEEVEVSRADAEASLHDTRDPLAILADRADLRARGLLAAMRSAAADAPIRHVGAFQNERARLPARLGVEGRTIPVVFEMDRTTFPGDQVHHEVEVEIAEDDAKPMESALHTLFARAGIAWRAAPSKARRFFDAAAGKPI
jgi:uncharacterized protein YjbK